MTSEKDGALSAQSLYERAVTFHQNLQFGDALVCYKSLLDALPDNPDLLHLSGLASYQLGDVKDAEDRIRAAIELNTDCGDYHSNLGLVLKAGGNYDAAIASFRRALELDEDFPDFLSNLGITYLANRQPEEAEKVFRRLLSVHPGRSDGYNNLAVLLAKQGKETEAIGLYETALELRSNYIDARENYWRLLMRMERFDDAIEQQKVALGIDEGNATVHRDLGETLHKLGRANEALVACNRSLELLPSDASCHVTKGNVLLSLDETAEAERHFRQALELDPDNPRALNNIGTILMAAQRTNEALDHFDASARHDPDFVAAVFNQGSALQSLGRLDEAIQKFKAAILLQPNLSKAYRYLAEIYRAKKSYSDEEKVLQQWLTHCPNSPTAIHLLNALGKGPVPDRAPDDFVREEFDEFADSFEETLARLSYKTPQFIGNILAEALRPAEQNLAVLDAGCGTGLCAPFLRPHSSHLVGVDLSSNMIDIAGKKKIYDELIVAELLTYMSSCESLYDVVVSADTLVYFGSLKKVLAAAAKALKSGGIFAFSVEVLEDAQEIDFHLNSSGRYSHSKDHVMQCMHQAGFAVDVVEKANLRTEMHLPVLGLLFLGRLNQTHVDRT